MKKILRTISLSGISIICFFSCGKNNPTPPNPGNNGKLCRVVDYSDNASSVTAGDVWHLLFQYNDKDVLKEAMALDES